jgi:hypothetical protein
MTMATFSVIPIPCPRCGELISVPLTPGPVETNGDGRLVATMVGDAEPLREHVEQHRSRKWLLLEVARRYAIPCSHLAEAPDYLLRHMLSFRPGADEGEA